MSDEPTDPASRLAAILGRENEALRRGDLRTVAAWTAEKLAAAEAMAKSPHPAPDAERLQDLRALATENQRLLARALEVQQRVISIVATAGVKARTAPGYGANGNLASGRAIAPFALSAQA